jgi:PPOX class probable F420-dependent enzyme
MAGAQPETLLSGCAPAYARAMGISDEKFIRVTTYRKSGKPVSTPTWVVPLDGGKVGFWTSSRTGKVKRLRNNASVAVVPSDSRGRAKPDAAELTGTAVLVEGGAEYDAIQSKVRAKYGLMVHVSHLFNTIGHIGKGRYPYGDLGVVVTLREP